jgi:RimJ/RimL family protein N-acetyltransferase
MPSDERIRTERLVLLRITGERAQEILDGVPLGRTTTVGWPDLDSTQLLLGISAAASDGWLITLADTGAVIGVATWKGGPDADGVADIGYAVAGVVRGNGYAGEAVRELVAFWLGQPGCRALTARVHESNTPSRRLLERIGFVIEAVEHPWLTYQLLPPRPQQPTPPVGDHARPDAWDCWDSRDHRGRGG